MKPEFPIDENRRDRMAAHLGEPSEFIITGNNSHLVRKWAIASGYDPIKVNVMRGVDLANLYHESGKKSNGVPFELAADMFVKIMEAVKAPGFNVDHMRQIAEMQFNDQFNNWSDIIANEIERRVAELPPKYIEIKTPDNVTILDGTVHYRTELVIRTAALNHPIMMVGPAGCGKTTIGQHVATALALPFYITSTINDTHELTGFVDGYGKYHTTPFRQAFEHGGVWVADEIDAWDASALLAANSALANGYSVFPDRPNPTMRHNDFRIVATANTFGSGADRVYVGRNELDAASLDRFAVIEVDYDLNLERMFARGNTQWLEHVWKIRKRVNEKRIRHVVSSRAITMGAMAIAAGTKYEDVEEMYLFKGMSSNDREKIK